VKEMMKYDELKEEFSIFETYSDNRENVFNFHGSYTDIFGKIQVSNFFAHPITSNSFKKVRDSKEKNTLCNRVDCYQNDVSSPLKNWLNKNSLDYEKLHSNCAELLNIGRVCFINDLKKMKNIKKESKYADHILGIPEEKIKLSRRFCISKRGNNSFYEKLYFFLNNKINIEFNSKIQVQPGNDKNIKILNRGKSLDVDHIIWAANPVYILKELGYGVLDNPVVKVKIYCSEIEIFDSPTVENFYIQVFSLKTNIFRIYFYRTNTKYKITVETFFNKENNSLDEDSLRKILSHFNFRFKLKGISSEKKEVRHYLMSKKDFNTFEKFNADFKNTNLINGGWHLNGRERKIEHIMNNFN
jgi:hypothetical protein